MPLVPDRGETPTWGLLGESSVVLLGACHVLHSFHFLLSSKSKEQYQQWAMQWAAPFIDSVLRVIIGLHEFILADYRLWFWLLLMNMIALFWTSFIMNVVAYFEHHIRVHPLRRCRTSREVTPSQSVKASRWSSEEKLVRFVKSLWWMLCRM